MYSILIIHWSNLWLTNSCMISPSIRAVTDSLISSFFHVALSWHFNFSHTLRLNASFDSCVTAMSHSFLRWLCFHSFSSVTVLSFVLLRKQYSYWLQLNSTLAATAFSLPCSSKRFLTDSFMELHSHSLNTAKLFPLFISVKMCVSFMLATLFSLTRCT